MPVSIGVVQAASEYVVIRMKKLALAALWLTTFAKLTVWLPVGAATSPDLLKRSEPAVAVLTVQPEASPRFVGCDASVDEATENPAGVVQVPLAVVHAVNDADWTTVADGTVKLKVYVVLALAAEVPITTFLPVICAANTLFGTRRTPKATTITILTIRVMVPFIFDICTPLPSAF